MNLVNQCLFSGEMRSIWTNGTAGKAFNVRRFDFCYSSVEDEEQKSLKMFV
jgi:hypothetical protein